LLEKLVKLQLSLTNKGYAWYLKVDEKVGMLSTGTDSVEVVDKCMWFDREDEA